MKHALLSLPGIVAVIVLGAPACFAQDLAPGLQKKARVAAGRGIRQTGSSLPNLPKERPEQLLRWRPGKPVIRHSAVVARVTSGPRI